MGKELVTFACSCDTGAAAFTECCQAREQLECIVQSLGYDMTVYIFGGLAVMQLLEVGGDADFVGITDVEPEPDESAAIIVRINRELKRLGLKSRCYPKARVPVVKADRVSKVFPGTPFHSSSSDGFFQFARQLNSAEVESFEKRVRNYGAASVEWNASFQLSTVRFHSPSALISAVAHITSHDGVDIPLRHPVDVVRGPQIYRFPFDFCLVPTGLRNSYLLAEALSEYEYSRHLLLALKKWGRTSGIINSMDGLLASYALTVLLTHYLIKMGKVQKISIKRISEEPQSLRIEPEYKPLRSGADCPFDEIGRLFAGFFEYYGSVFDYQKNVVCTTNLSLTKEKMNWTQVQPFGKAPFFDIAIKDPYGLDNIARNVDAASADYIKKCFAAGNTFLINNFDSPTVAIRDILYSPPKPYFKSRTLLERGIQSPNVSNDQLEALHVLDNMEFQRRRKSVEQFGRRAAQNSENQQKATVVAKNVLGWIKDDIKPS